MSLPKYGFLVWFVLKVDLTVEHVLLGYHKNVLLQFYIYCVTDYIEVTMASNCIEIEFIKGLVILRMKDNHGIFITKHIKILNISKVFIVKEKYILYLKSYTNVRG